MDSFDLYDTLVAGPDPEVPAGDQSRLFPIAANIAMVKPDDVIISDYYDVDKAVAELNEVAGLKNTMMITVSGKRQGTIWDRVPTVETHTGDNPDTDGTCKRLGITFSHSTISRLTGFEQDLVSRGWTALAYLIREARLTELSRVPYLEHEQNQLINFAMLFFGSIMLHQRMTGYDSMLMSGRDCCLWVRLMEKMRDILGGDYDVKYFHSSRMCRAKASENYQAYVSNLMGERPVLVDLAGYGKTLTKLMDVMGMPEVPIYLLVQYPSSKYNRAIGLTTANRPDIEQWNFATEPMVGDVDGQWQPIAHNPEKLNWQNPLIKDAHRIFDKCVSLMETYAPDLKRAIEVATTT